MQLYVAVSRDDVDVFDRKIGKDDVFFFITKKRERLAVLEKIHLT